MCAYRWPRINSRSLASCFSAVVRDPFIVLSIAASSIGILAADDNKKDEYSFVVNNGSLVLAWAGNHLSAPQSIYAVTDEYSGPQDLGDAARSTYIMTIYGDVKELKNKNRGMQVFASDRYFVDIKYSIDNKITEVRVCPTAVSESLGFSGRLIMHETGYLIFPENTEE